MYNLPPFSFDLNTFSAINRWHSSFFDYFFLFFSYIGEFALIWLLIGSIIVFINKKNGWQLLLWMVLALLTTTVINSILKIILFRERPYLFLQNIHHLGPDWQNSAFISGHTASSIAALIILFNYERDRRSVFPSSPIHLLHSTLYLLLSIFIILSRLYLGMHYPSDILGGLVVGIAAGAFALRSGKKMLKFLYASHRDKKPD